MPYTFGGGSSKTNNSPEPENRVWQQLLRQEKKGESAKSSASTAFPVMRVILPAPLQDCQQPDKDKTLSTVGHCNNDISHF